MKNIALFCDGTWQNLSQRFPTNVTRLARAVTPQTDINGSSVAQVVWYDDGVGVGNGVLNQAQQILGGAFGEGLDAKIAAAYEFLCLNYCPGDQIFIFGFSRGAYTARSLAGLLRRVWVLKRRNIGLVDSAMEIYRNHSKDAVETTLFRHNNCYEADVFIRPREADPKTAVGAEQEQGHLAAVQYVGVWDTVGSLGVPSGLPFADHFNDKYRFHDESLSRFVVSARHAVAIDERRDTFSPALWDNISGLNVNAGADALLYADRPYQQQWFAGRHSSVGGGEDDGGVSINPLLWICEGAMRAGLAFSDEMIDIYKTASEPAAPFTTAHRTIADYIVAATGERDRAGPLEWDEVSEAARLRWRLRPDYRPGPLTRWAAQLAQP